MGGAGASDARERPWPFSVVRASDADAFVDALGGDATRGLTRAEDVKKYSVDWMGKYVGASAVVVLPRTTEEVSKVMRHCHARRIAVVPQGGNTGLVGGGTPTRDEVVVSLERMRDIVSIDEDAGCAVCEAGVVLEELESAVRARGMTVPLDLGAKGKCQMGGCVSTNAGGLRLLRYGSLRGSVLGLEVVLPNGDVLDLVRTLRKDNTGYDLKQLFIGAEGTLGVVTKVAISTPRAPRSVNVALFGLESFAKCVEMLKLARGLLGEILSAYEFFDRESLDLVLAQLSGTRDPLPGKPCEFYVVIETSGSDAKHDTAKLDAFLNVVKSQRIVVDGVVGRDEKHAFALWTLRERISVALKYAGAVYKYDLSLPTARMYNLVVVLRDRLRPMFGSRVKVLGYGHAGDGNLHLNVSCAEYDDAIERAIEPFVYEYTRDERGSVSAEHGLGVMKAEEIHYSKDAKAVELMATMKRALDPFGIMNPYKVLPAAAVGLSKL
jgi:D-2-hydroxyglutarate dehydrogenase